ncbi:stress-activated MAP kinase [Epichloe bromicola]
MSIQGDALSVVNALVEFRSHNPTADICIVASKLGPTDFQESSGFLDYLDMLAESRIRVDSFLGADGSTRQVMHAKGIVVDDQVLFSTGAVMDTKTITKANFSIELPNQAAKIFQSYVNEAAHGDATHERRAELAAELARLGVIINEPVAGLTYVSRTQDALICGARLNLTLSLSELINPFSTRTLIHCAARGVDVMIQVRGLDAVSLRLLTDAMARYPNLRLEDTNWWEPRPHFNFIVADGAAASYLWSTQRNMVTTDGPSKTGSC